MYVKCKKPPFTRAMCLDGSKFREQFLKTVTQGTFLWNYFKIRPAVSEKKIFKNFLKNSISLPWQPVFDGIKFCEQFLIDWLNGVLHRFKQYFSHITATAHIIHAFLGFSSTRLGSEVSCPRTLPRKNPEDLVRLEPRTPELRVKHLTTEPRWILNNFWRGPPKEHSYQVWSKLAQRFGSRRCLKKLLTTHDGHITTLKAPLEHVVLRWAKNIWSSDRSMVFRL